MNRKLILSLAALAIAALALAACGSDDSSDATTEAATTTEEAPAEETTASGDSGGKGGTVEIEADPSGGLSYTTGDVSTKAGTVTIDFSNPAALGHDVRVEDSSGNDIGGTTVISESSESVDLDLEPGTYTYYCSVGGHRAGGMEATLTVE
ncbi:MAG TPA: plastocyanin/azurin family copper-binding protein [Solirubrobacterales bacterium]|nr:plastocyanin/azurin family copper-binding protein [Solirubrobacterales bacterium]